MSGDVRPIPGHPLYSATYDGQIIGPRGVMQGRLDAKGYRRVALRTTGKPVNHSVHSLVALAWHGPRPTGFHVAHEDGDKWNNAAANLAYKTPAANEGDKIRHWSQLGRRRHNAKLDAGAAVDIFTRYHAGRAGRHVLAAEYGVSRGAIDAVIYGWAWTHATGAERRGPRQPKTPPQLNTTPTPIRLEKP